MSFHKPKKQRGSSSGQRTGNGVTSGNTGRFSGSYASIPTTQRPTTSGDHSRNGEVTNGQLPKNATFNQMLTLNSNDEFSQLLASLGITQTDGLTPGQRDDWNKALLDMQLKHYADVEQRGYNEQVLAEQRQYDNPLNQLARLMGAGISRDAAIQLLSGSGGSGAGAGSALVGGAATDVPTGPAASESKLNEVQAGTAIAGSVFSAISCFTGLVQLGFSAPQALQQTQYLKNQNFLTGQQIKAYQSAGQAFSILKTAGAAADAFSSVGSAVDAISNLAKSGNQDALSFIANGGIQSMQGNAPFASQTLSGLYKSERSASDYARSFELEQQKGEAVKNLTNVQISKVKEEISNLQAEYAQIQASTEYTEAMTVTCRALGIKYDAETALTRAQNRLASVQTTLTQEQAVALGFENQINAAVLGTTDDAGFTYVDWYADEVFNKLVGNALLASRTATPEYADAQFRNLFNTEQATAAAMSLAALKSRVGINFERDYPEQFRLWQGLYQAGAYDWIDAMVKKESGGKVSLPFGIGWTTRGYSDYFNPVRVPYYVDESKNGDQYYTK